MARPIWKGFISFGLVNVPVELYPAESRSELHFIMLDSRE
jgi:DNA end-binding protein Ku